MTRMAQARRRFAPVLLAAAASISASGPSSSAPLLEAPAGGEALGDLSCEADPQWLDVKKKLFFYLQRLSDTGRLDVSRSVNFLTRGISEPDLARCPAGAAAVQLFLQVAMALANPAAASEVLHAEPWPEMQDRPWAELAQVPWLPLLASRWPFFWSLKLLRDLLIGSLGPSPGACLQLWEGLRPLEREALLAADPASAGTLAGIALDLPSGTAAEATARSPTAVASASSPCALARATMVLALLNATAAQGDRSASAAAAAPGGLSEAEVGLLARAQEEATARWPLELLTSPWPALPLLAAAERRAGGVALGGLLPVPLRGVVAYVNFRPAGMARARDIEASIASVERHWLGLPAAAAASPSGTPWPLLIFADAASAPLQGAALRERFPALDVRVAIIDDRDLAFPISHDHPFCSAGYRRAARFMAGPLYVHPALDEFTHLLLLDTEFEFTQPVPWDPLRHLYEQGGQLGYWQTHYEQSWSRTVFLTEISREFMRVHGLEPQIPELVSYWWDESDVPGGTLPVNIYGCLVAASLSFLRSELFQGYFRALDAFAGWDEQCWSPQSVLAIAAAFFLGDNELVELWVYGRHQKATKTPDDGWNLSKRGVLPSAQRPGWSSSSSSQAAAETAPS
mmetsp:Transcript_174933/g.560956  ORF Transcript_174933/g.560956 Transcript_174933/m.560956 type:complete len:630 (+) Transcript_174933:113-2002(+)